MKEIRLKKLRLLNFKGIRNLEIDFEGDRTDILAANGKGKSSILDAFSWLLFGKDSKERKPSGKSSFGLKTYDSDNVVIPRIPHEVEGLLTVDGEPVTLRRAFTEKWVKKAGQTEETFDGNEEERFFNDVPCSVADWNAKIAAICPEEDFRLITAPECFSARKMEVKRKMLVQMAGGVSDEEIAKGNDSFTELLALLKGKTLDELKKEVAAKKKRVKTEVESIPGRIDEQKREMPEAEDWNALAGDIAHREAEVAGIEDKLMSEARRREEADNRRLESTERLHEVRAKIQQRSHAIADRVFVSYREYQMKRNALLDEKKTLAKTVERTVGQIPGLEADLAAAKKRREKLMEEYGALKKKRDEIKTEQISFSEADFRCPTCGRTFEPDRIEARQSEMLARFEEQRKTRLATVAAEIDDNIARGRRNNDVKDTIVSEIEECRKRIADAERRMAEIDGSDNLKKNLTPPDATPAIDSDGEIISLRQEEARLMEMTGQTSDDNSLRDELSAQREAIRKEIKELQQRMFKRDEIDRRTKRISELTTQLQHQNRELDALEKLEFTITAFAKARIDAVEDKINSMFGIVKFRLFNRLVNGGEEEICDATLNGVPYPDCSTAEKINMGLDIINAISRFKGVSAPIFIDNAESVIDILPTGTQVIRLVVSPQHDRLTVTNL